MRGISITLPEAGAELATRQDEASCARVLAIPPDRSDGETGDEPVPRSHSPQQLTAGENRLSDGVPTGTHASHR